MCNSWGQRPHEADPGRMRGALTADPTMLLREITGISQQIFWYNTQPRCIYTYKYMYIPAALYTAHCTNAYRFPQGLEYLAGTDDVIPRGSQRLPWRAPSFCCAISCSCHAQNCLSRAEARCSSSPEATDPWGPLPAGPLFLWAYAFPRRVVSAASLPI